MQVTKDIFVITDEMPDGSVVQKFYDDEETFIAGIDKDGKIYPSAEFANEDLSFLGQLENISNGPSLNELDEKLEMLSRELGISKEDVLSMSETDLDKTIGEKGDSVLSLDDNDDEEQKTLNANALDNISSKQETDLNNKVDDRHTLADILGVPAGSKLIAVYSTAIVGNKNTTRFSFIIQNPDGTLEPADMLDQVGGKDSDKKIHETNRDGSEVEEVNVQSSYAIKSPIVPNAILTARVGSMGYIELRIWTS